MTIGLTSGSIALAEARRDLDLARRECRVGLSLLVRHRLPAFGYLDRTEPQLDALGVEAHPRVAHRGEDPAPVGVLPEDRRLDQVAPDYALGQRRRRRFVLCPLDYHLDQPRGALAVASDLLRQRPCHALDSLREGRKARRIERERLVSSGAVGEQNRHVARRGIAVHRYTVEGALCRLAQILLQSFLLHGGVSGQKGEHGSHVRVDHAAPLGRPADGDGRAPDLHPNSHLFGAGVGGQHRLGETGAIPPKLHRCRTYSRRDLVHGQVLADDARRRHSYLFSPYPQSLRR
jgi:hypothetical protein